MSGPLTSVLFFFFNDTATTEIYTLSLHDALPICGRGGGAWRVARFGSGGSGGRRCRAGARVRQPTIRSRRCDRMVGRSEEHTSELQSPDHLVCRLLLEKKKKQSRMTRSCDETTTR